VCTGLWESKEEDLDAASLKMRDTLCPPEKMKRSNCTGLWESKEEDLDEESLRIRDTLCPPKESV
jgi:hypothetical protein